MEQLLMDPSDSKGVVVKVEAETAASAERSMKRVKAEGGFSQTLEAPDQETPSAGKTKAEISTEDFFNALSVTKELMDANPSTVWLHGHGFTSDTDSKTDSEYESDKSEYEYESEAEAAADEGPYDISLPALKREYYLTKADMAFKSRMLAKMGAKMLATEFDNQNLHNMVKSLKADLNRKRAEVMVLVNNCMSSGNFYDHIKALFLMKMVSEKDNEYFREMCKVYAARGVKSCNHPLQFQAQIQRILRSITAAAAASVSRSRCCC